MHYLACFASKSVRQNSSPFSTCPHSVPMVHRYLPHIFPERQARDQTFRYAKACIWYFYSSPTLCSLWHISPRAATSLSFSSGYLLLVWIRLWRHEPPYEHTPFLVWYANDWLNNFVHRPNIFLLSYLGSATLFLAVVRSDCRRKFRIVNRKTDHNDDVQPADFYYTSIWRNRGRGSSKDSNSIINSRLQHNNRDISTRLSYWPMFISRMHMYVITLVIRKNSLTSYSFGLSATPSRTSWLQWPWRSS
jgi:hypothetical protein